MSSAPHQPDDCRRIKVLVAGPTKPPSGGISTVLNDMMASSLKDKLTWVLHDNSKRTPANRTLWQGIKSQVALLREYVSLLRSKRPDLVHVHSGGSPDFYRKSIDVILARLFRTRVVFHNKGGDFNFFAQKGGLLKKIYIRFILNRCDRVMVLSEWWKEFHSAYTDPERIRVLYNGVNPAPYDNNVSREEARRMLDIPGDRVVFLMMGVKGRRKGVYDIIEAAPKMRKMGAEPLLLLVGPDENISQGATGELEALRVERGVENLVELRGEADASHRYLYYAAADCFLLPSYAENSPVSIIEAMAARLPVIATRIAAVPELVDDGITGILIDPGKPDQIAEAVVKLTTDADLRRKMGEEALEKFRRRFDMEKAFVKTLYGIYEEVASLNKPKSACSCASKFS